MRAIVTAIAIILACVVWPRGAFAQASSGLSAELAFGNSARREGGWELLRVNWAGVGLGREVTVSVQDARVAGPPSGLRVSRVLTPQVAGGENPTLSALLPLPLVARAQLAEGAWPVEVMVDAGNGAVVRGHVVVKIGAVGEVASEPFRAVAVADPQGESARDAFAASRATVRPIQMLSMPEEELIAGPALLFASCDAVLLSAGVRARLDARRVAALVNAGVSLVVMDEDAPRGAVLAPLVWDQLHPALRTVADKPVGWISPALEMRQRAPGVLLGALAEMPQSIGDPGIAGSTRWTALLLGPAALVALFLARGIFRRPAAAALGLCAGMGIVAVLAWGVLRGDRSATTLEIGWQTTAADAHAARGAWVTGDRVTVITPRFAREVEARGAEGGMLMPVAVGPRAYFQWRDETLVLREDASMLNMPAAERQAVAFRSHTSTAGGVVPAFPRNAEESRAFEAAMGVTLAKGWWVTGGYVFAGGLAPPVTEDQAGGEIFSSWARELGGVAEVSARGWYAIACDPARLYFCDLRAGELRVIDFGERARVAGW